MNNSYEHDKLIGQAKKNNREIEIWAAIMAIGIIIFLIIYFSTQCGWWLIGCLCCVVLPLPIMWRVESFFGNRKQKDACDIAKENGEPIYYYEGKLMLTSNDQLVYFDRLTSTIYTWPDNVAKYRVIFEDDMDWFGTCEFDPQKVKYKEIK